MSRPITWQTINAPSLGDPNRSMQGVTQSIGDAFTPLREQLRAYQGNEAKNWEVGKENNTEAFMAQLTSRYKTPQELAAAQASGELDQLRSSFGAQIDQARTREALDNRGSVLQQRDLTKRTYDNLVIEDTIRPQMQEALSYIQKNDRTGFDNFLLDPKNAALKAMKQGDLMGMLKKVEFENAEEGRRVSQDGRNAATLAETLRNGEASRDNMLAGQQNAQAQLGLQREQLNVSRADAAARLRFQEAELGLRIDEKKDAYLDRLLKQRGDANPSVLSREGTQFVLDGLKKVVTDPRQLKLLNAKFGEITADKELNRATPEAVLSALVGDVSTGRGWRTAFYDGTGDNAKDSLRATLDSTGYKEAEAFARERMQKLEARIWSVQNPGREMPSGGAGALPSGSGAAAAAVQQVPVASAADPAASLRAGRPTPKVVDFGNASPGVKARQSAAVENLPKAQEAFAAAQLALAEARTKGPMYEQKARMELNQARNQLREVRDRLPPGFEEAGAKK